MSARPDIPIFNHHDTTMAASFHQFPHLPKELRLMIWRQSLCRQRIIKVHLSDPWVEDPSTIRTRFKSEIYEPSWALQRFGDYLVTVHTSQVLSKLFRVCRESRLEAMAHYRVHIPCRFLLPSVGQYHSLYSVLVGATHEDRLSTVLAPGTIYFNPEWDFLKITCWPNTTALLPPFLNDLKNRYDPRGIGLLNLVVSHRDAGSSGDVLDVEPANVRPEFWTGFVKTLQQLDEVFFSGVMNYGRMNFGIVQCISDERWFNRSFPLSTNIPAFDRYTADPRPISKDLEKQFLGFEDWSKIYRLFLNLLSRFDLSDQTGTTRFKIMITHEGRLLNEDGGREIMSRADAEKWLQKDHERLWLKHALEPSKYTGKAPFEGQEYVTEVEPAFGFWLFPVEVAEIIANNKNEKIFDMRMYVPELGLAVMPGESGRNDEAMGEEITAITTKSERVDSMVDCGSAQEVVSCCTE